MKLRHIDTVRCAWTLRGYYTSRMTAIESDNTANGARCFAAAAHMSYSCTVVAQSKGNSP